MVDKQIHKTNDEKFKRIRTTLGMKKGDEDNNESLSTAIRDELI